MEVEVWAYDISNGAAESMLRGILGVEVEGIWHTSVVVFSTEYYFFSGIKRAVPGTTHFGAPKKKISFGVTNIGKQELDLFLEKNKDLYTDKTYDLFQNNCNHFTNALLMYLVGEEVPAYIMELSNALKDTPLGEMIKAAFMMPTKDIE